MIARRAPLVLLLAVALAACGSEANLRRHAYAAQVLEDVAAAGRAHVLAELRDELTAAANGVADPAERERLVGEARVRFEARGLIDAANAVIEAKDAYVRAVLLAAQHERPALAELLPPLRSAIAAYVALHRAVGDDSGLPEIPTAVLEMIP